MPGFLGFSEVGRSTSGGGQGRIYHLPLSGPRFSFSAPLAKQTKPVQKEFMGENEINKLEGETGRKDQRS